MKKPPYPAYITNNTRALRQNMTDAEKKIWHHLRDRRFDGLKFKRQYPFPPYILDFYCQDLNLVIELDGGQHNPEIDADRTKFLEDQGCHLIRFWNNDVLANTDGVLMTLQDQISRLLPPLPLGEGRGEGEFIRTSPLVPPHPNPLPKGEGT